MKFRKIVAAAAGIALSLSLAACSGGGAGTSTTTTSAANGCLYCVVAHGALLRIYEKKPLVTDQVATNYRKADIT